MRTNQAMITAVNAASLFNVSYKTKGKGGAGKNFEGSITTRL